MNTFVLFSIRPSNFVSTVIIRNSISHLNIGAIVTIRAVFNQTLNAIYNKVFKCNITIKELKYLSSICNFNRAWAIYTILSIILAKIASNSEGFSNL